ncbi:hypothetical protein B0H11DRAFT_1877212 [Mycena galericulata]|nr:hypothetical protein B0H11DRAFT_1877212 [Mycena galericulata]
MTASCPSCAYRNLEKLWSNKSPPFSEVSPGVRQRSVAEQRVTLTEIKSKIVRCKNELDALEKEQQEVEDGLALVVYPILTLPNEITSRIFIDCLPTDGPVCPSPHTAPLLLAQICRHWREVAFSTRKIWSSIRLSSPSSGEPPQHVAGALLQTWVSRAKGHPLSLGFHSNHETGSPDFMSFVSSCSAQIRWLELDLMLEQSRQNDPLYALPLLQHLATGSMPDEALVDVLKSAPPIHELRLTRANTVDFPQPWLVTDLEICSISVETFLGLPTNFPVLAHLKCGITGRFKETGAPKVFPQLSSLVFTPKSDGVRFAIKNVTLPSLRRLEIPDYMPLIDVTSLISRSSCVLHHVVIAAGYLEAAAADLFEALPSLESLKIDVYEHADILVRCLNSSDVLPRIKALTILSSTPPYINYELLIQMLHRRRNPNNRFKIESCHLNFTDLWDDPAEFEAPTWSPGYLAASELRRLIGAGLELSAHINTKLNYNTNWP